MTISEVVAIAKKVHDAEGHNLGSASTRESRNAFWARAIGCVHHGHPIYNPTPDKQWNIKNAGGGRPQSDDVAAQLPSRLGYDCIPLAGSDGYSFNMNPGSEVLGPEQVIYAPPVPAGGGGTVPGPDPCASVKAELAACKAAAANSVPKVGYPGDAVWDEFGRIYESDVQRAGQTLNAQSFRWAGRTIHDDYMEGLTLEQSIAKHRAEWCAILGIPVI